MNPETPNQNPTPQPGAESSIAPTPAATPAPDLGVAPAPADTAVNPAAPAAQTPVAPVSASASTKSKLPFLLGVGLVAIVLIAAIVLLMF